MAWSQEQLRNAAIIARVGQQVGASRRDIQVALMAAIVESGLRNLNYGDRDSIGMFQQRNAWGSRSARLDPYQSARMFFLGGHAGQRGLLDFADRNRMSMGQAAQAVQVSAFPDRYAQHQSEAAGLLGRIGGVKVGDVPDAPGVEVDLGALTPDPSPTLELGTLGPLSIPEPPSVTEVNGIGEITADEAGIGEMNFEDANQTDPFSLNPAENPALGIDPMARLHMPDLQQLLKQVNTTQQGTGGPQFTLPTGGGEGWRSAVVAAARKMLGVPYVWGGTSPSGVDCSGLVQLIYNRLGFHLPRISADQARSGKRIPLSELRPGDLVAWDNSSRNNGADHIAIALGNGLIIEAPRPGKSVQISRIYGNAWGVRIVRR